MVLSRFRGGIKYSQATLAKAREILMAAKQRLQAMKGKRGGLPGAKVDFKGKKIDHDPDSPGVMRTASAPKGKGDKIEAFDAPDRLNVGMNKRLRERDYDPPTPKSVKVEGDAQKRLDDLFGHPVDVKSKRFLESVSAYDGTVRVIPSAYKGEVRVEVEGPRMKDGTPKYSASRQIRKDEAGDLIVWNGDIRSHPSIRGGWGTTTFARQVQALSKMGVKRIEMNAAKGPTFNGYSTYAKAGADAPLAPHLMAKLKHDAPEGVNLGKANRVSDLMNSPKGREWWDKNGESTRMAFNLSNGSPHYVKLERRMKEIEAYGGGSPRKL